MKIALLTATSVNLEEADDAPFERALRARGHDVEWVAWDTRPEGLERFEAAVIRSTWGYHERPEDFAAFLDRCEHTGVRLWNPVPVVRWNMHKAYLLELMSQGVPTAPLEHLTRGTPATLSSVRARVGEGDVVVKPAISGGAFETFRADAVPDAERRFAELVAARDVLVQAFVPEIVTEGEWALLYFGGEFSHAVLKRAAPGDFRVQHMFGGTIESLPPPRQVRALADAALQAVRAPLLYARVDLVDTRQGPRLMELELIEPWLFFAQEAAAAPQMALALERLAKLR